MERGQAEGIVFEAAETLTPVQQGGTGVRGRHGTPGMPACREGVAYTDSAMSRYSSIWSKFRYW